MRTWLNSLVLLFCALLSGHAHAHELRPAFLSISETTANEYKILWKTPALGDKQLALKVEFPKTCTVANGRRQVEENKFAIETWSLRCPQTLHGQGVNISGLEKTLTDVLVKVQWQDGSQATHRLTPDRPHLVFDTGIPNQFAGAGVIKTYFLLGVEHILGGIDHLLFVLAVMLLVSRRKTLLAAVTAFTLGHSVTLALASLGYVSVNPGLVELLIAMSIVLMAYEAARRWQGQSGLTMKYPWIVTFVFGLLHGFGFAGALKEIGLPKGDIPAALLFFNIGVEAGQLLFIAGVLVLYFFIAKPLKQNQKPLMLAAAYIIGTVAVFWSLQRFGVVGVLRA